MNETEKAFKTELAELCKKYGATFELVDDGREWDMCKYEIQVECNPPRDCEPFAVFNIPNYFDGDFKI